MDRYSLLIRSNSTYIDVRYLFLMLFFHCGYSEMVLITPGSKKWATREQLLKILKCSQICRNPIRVSATLNPLSIQFISLHTIMHEVHFGKFHIGVIMNVVLNQCEKWWSKPTGSIYPPLSTAHSNASTLHFCTHIPVWNLLI